jgi:hypothetical protein
MSSSKLILPGEAAVTRSYSKLAAKVQTQIAVKPGKGRRVEERKKQRVT